MSDDPRVKQLFEAAIRLPTAARAAYLDEQCPPELREEVEGLLVLHEAPTVKRDLDLAPFFDPDETEIADNGDQLPFTSLNEFSIIRRLGTGGMATVYLALDTSPLNNFVAIKVLHDASEAQVRRFWNEASLLAQLQHPRIVKAYKVGFDKGVHYIVMHYIQGTTLEMQLIHRRGAPLGTPIPDAARQAISSKEYLKQQVAILADIADALHHAHLDKRVVHRDIKPSNILIDQTDQAWLSDFGVAKHLERPGMTQSDFQPGTVPYMSPEQARAHDTKVDFRSDIFSMGVVLYQMITLDRPFSGSPPEIIDQILWHEPRAPRHRNRAARGDLESICLMALEKEPNRRYQNAATMAGDLRSYLDGLPVIARQRSPIRKAHLWMRGHKLQTMVAAIAVLLVVIGGLVVNAVVEHRRTLCRIVIDGDDEGATILIRSKDEATLRFGPARRAGTLPFDERLAPGQYRFIVIVDDGRFVERTVVLLEPGTATSINVTIPDDISSVVHDMVLIPAGTHQFGTVHGLEVFRPKTIALPAFLIDRYEVTNAQYTAFMEEDGYELNPPLAANARRAWESVAYDSAYANHPVVGVSLADAQAYATWVGKRLPTVFEWEAAMRYPDGRLLPWGDEVVELGEPDRTTRTRSPVESKDPWERGMQRYREHSRPVNGDPRLATAGPSRIFHGSSNVDELTETVLFDEFQVVYKGANWSDSPGDFDLSRAGTWPLDKRSLTRGFRCVRSVTAAGDSTARTLPR